MSRTTPTIPQSHHPRRAFTLIELLTVILIVVVVISIVLPALSQARKSARKTEAALQLKTLSDSIAKYVTDVKRNPGYFTAAEMGHAENETEGMSAMQNIMLDLAGGVVKDGTAGEVKVGPKTLAASKVSVLPGNIGLQTAGQNIYFSPTAKAWRNIPSVISGGSGDFGNRLSVDANAALNELVDPFGTPILAWALDETVRVPMTGPLPGPVGPVTQFARKNSGAAGDQKSRFYWASNSAFLSDNAQLFVGRQRRNPAQTGRESILHGGVTTADLERTLMGVLGNPSSPLAFSPTGATPVADIRPSAARGSIILHSAGDDGIYFSSTDKTPRRIPGGVVDYGYTHKINDTTPVTDSNGGPSSDDLLNGFDDIVQAAN